MDGNSSIITRDSLCSTTAAVRFEQFATNPSHGRLWNGAFFVQAGLTHSLIVILVADATVVSWADGHSRHVTCLDVSAHDGGDTRDGMLVSGSLDGSIIIWTMICSGSRLDLCRKHKVRMGAEVSSLALDFSHLLVVVGTQDNCHLLDASHGTLLRSFPVLKLCHDLIVKSRGMTGKGVNIVLTSSSAIPNTSENPNLVHFDHAIAALAFQRDFSIRKVKFNHQTCVFVYVTQLSAPKDNHFLACFDVNGTLKCVLHAHQEIVDFECDPTGNFVFLAYPHLTSLSMLSLPTLKLFYDFPLGAPVDAILVVNAFVVLAWMKDSQTLAVINSPLLSPLRKFSLLT